ncbi:MAG: lytic transglycosylase domain-containing protein [Parvibaculum sp.]|nr:lytic transglycosylase domain-containing protein [Parvibaculum sp.]
MSLVEAIAVQPNIATAIKAASQRTGTGFDYLLKTAMRESSLNHDAKSTTSSASGLFQFTEQSWLGTLKTHGAELGLGDYSAAITQTANGRYVVANTAEKAEILALRDDARASALMAGAYTQDSAAVLERRLGRDASEGELYIAHFLGAGGAAKLIGAAEDTPNARADTLFPAAAAANTAIFYGADGQARSVSDVYANLVAKHENMDEAQLVQAARNRPLPPARYAHAAQRSGDLAGNLAGGEVRRGYMTRGATLPSPGAGQSSGGSFSGMSGTSYGRAPLKLSPAVVQILSSLDPFPAAGAASHTGKESDDNADARDIASKRREERNETRLAERPQMLPRSGFAFG